MTILVTVILFVPTGLVAVFPLIFVYSGLEALGGRLGLWVGDPNSNDGEEYWAWPVGLAMLACLFGMVALIMYALRSRGAIARWAWPAGLAIVLAVGAGTMFVGLPPPFWQW